MKMTRRIPIREIEFHPHSFGDQGLRLFRWRGQLYRAVAAERAPAVRKLLGLDAVWRHSGRNTLIETEETPFVLPGYEMVLHHRLVPFVSYPTEWCAAMLKDAALVMLDLAIELARNGYTLGDAHPWNLLIDIERNCAPVFVDFGSISPVYTAEWPAYDEFCRYCYYPLVLMSRGEDQIGRLLMWEDSGVSKEQVVRLAGGSSLRSSVYPPSISRALLAASRKLVPGEYRRALKRRLNAISRQPRGSSGSETRPGGISDQIKLRAHQQFLEGVRRRIEQIPMPRTAPLASKANHAEPIGRLLDRLRPESVLTVGQDAGAGTLLAAKGGINTVAFSTDPGTVASLYQVSRTSSHRILPLVMDPTKPTPARGFADHWSIAAADRLRCDMVLALSFAHEVVTKRGLSFEQTAEGLSTLAKRWVLVEFTGDPVHGAPELRASQRSWYNLENFTHALRSCFRRVAPLPGGSGRSVLLLCGK